MNPQRFDQLSKRFAGRLSRRQTLRLGIASAATITLAATGSAPAGASDATPAATAGASASGVLFAQPFSGGTWIPKTGGSGAHTLTLHGVGGLVDYVSNGPDCMVGLVRLPQFLDRLSFTAAIRPTAAIVVETATGREEALIVALSNPDYAAGSNTLTYEATVIADYTGRGLASLTRAPVAHALASSFGEGAVFYDDCPLAPLYCYQRNTDGSRGAFVGPTPNTDFCWNAQEGRCWPCNDPSAVCAAAFPGKCLLRRPGAPPVSSCGAAGFTWPPK